MVYQMVYQWYTIGIPTVYNWYTIGIPNGIPMVYHWYTNMCICALLITCMLLL